MPTKKEISLGLDIGTRLIKLLEFSTEGGAKRIAKLDAREIDFPLNKENVRSCLKSLFEKFRPSVKDIRISLSAPSAIVRFINMPRMKEDDLRSSLCFEAEKYIPFNIKEVVIDSSILDYQGEDRKQMKVLFAAAKRDAVDSRVSMLKDLGFSVSIIDVDSFACFNAFCHSADAFDDSITAALLNIGYMQTNLIISRGAQPFFTRDIQIGAKDIANIISEKMHVPKEKAEEFIFKLGEGGTGAEVYEAAKPVLNNLTDELRLSFGYYENQHGRSVNEIYISGGMARLNNLARHFEENFEIKTALWNPFAKFEVSSQIDVKSLETLQSQFAVCVGLVIRK